MSNILQIFKILKLRLLVVARAVQGKRGLFYDLVLLVVSLIFAYGKGYTAKVVLNSFLITISFTKTATAELVGGGSLVLIVLTIMIVAMDLLFAHTINLGQRTGDGEFLLSLPISINDFYLVKTIERAITDGMSHVLILPLFVAWALMFSKTHVAILVALFSYFLFQIMVSSFLVGLNIALSTCFSISQVKKIVNWAAFGATIAFFYGQMFLSGSKWLSSLSPDFLLHPIFSYLPSTWISGTMVWCSLEPSKAMVMITIVLIFCSTIFFLMRKAIKSFDKTGFATGKRQQSKEQASKTRRQSSKLERQQGKLEKRLIKGLWWKDITLLKRDSEIIINGFLLPAFIFLISAWGIKSSIPALYISEVHILTIAVMFLGYFHMFGALNCVGSEGQAIALLASWFISETGYLVRKVCFWGLAGWFVSLLVWLITCEFIVKVPISNYSALKGTITLFLCSTILSVTAVSFSVLFANYKAKFLQQGTSFSAKIGQSVISLIICIAIFSNVQTRILHVLAILVFVAIALFTKASDKLAHGDDMDIVASPKARAGTVFIITTICYGLSLILPLLTALYWYRNENFQVLASLFSYKNENLFFINLITVNLIQIVGLIGALKYTELVDFGEIKASVSNLVIKMKSGFPRITVALLSLCCGMATASIVCKFKVYELTRLSVFSHHLNSLNDTSVTVMIVLSLCFVMPVCEELFFRFFLFNNLTKSKVGKYGVWFVMILVSSLFALLHPLTAFWPLFFAALVFNALYVTTGKLFPSIIAHSAYNLFILSQWGLFF